MQPFEQPETDKAVENEEDRDHQIGHSHFMGVSDEAGFNRIFDKHVIPLLQEYCYDDYTALAEYLGPRLVDAQAQTLNEDLLADTEGLLRALEEEFMRRGESPA